MKTIIFILALIGCEKALATEYCDLLKNQINTWEDFRATGSKDQAKLSKFRDIDVKIKKFNMNKEIVNCQDLIGDGMNMVFDYSNWEASSKKKKK